MESAGAPAGDRRAVWAARGLLLAFGVLLTLPIFTRKPGAWDDVYLAAAVQLRAGGDLERNTNGYVYPPFSALFAVPFSHLPRPLALGSLAVLNLAAVAVLLAGTWRLSGGRGLPGKPGTGAVDVAAFWLGGLLATGFLLDSAANWQLDLVIGAALVGGCVLLAAGRGVAAGAAFGFAAAFKLTPLLFAPYLAWKRQFAGAAAVVVVAAGLNLLPDALYPRPTAAPRLVAWAERFVAPLGKQDRDPGEWASAVQFNHSLAGVTRRWLAFDRGRAHGSIAAIPKAERPPASELKALNLACVAALGLVALVAFWRRPADLTPGPVLAAELGAVFALMLLLSPMSSKAHFGVLLLPQLALVRVGWAHRDRLLLALVAVCGVLGLCTGKDLVGNAAYEFLLWNGLVFWLTVALFLGCCHARFRYGPRRDVTPAGREPAPARRAA